MNKKVLIWIFVMSLLVVPVWGALSDGLEDYWTFDSDATDSLNRYNGTITGATSISGIIGNAYNYSAGQYIRYGTAQSLGFTTGNFTVSFWINPYDTSNNHVLGRGGWKTGGWNIILQADNQIGLLLSNSGDRGFKYTNSANCSLVAGGGWYHVVLTKTGNPATGKGWINGVECAMTQADPWDAGQPTNVSDDLFQTGGQDDASAYGDNLAGLDEIGIWSRELSASEVSELYANGLGSQFPFAIASTSTDIDFTITDQWNGSSINTFNVDVSWSNGTTTQHTTTNGTVSLINVSSGAINVTYYNMTDYFNQTTSATIAENVSNSVSTTTYQAVLCLNATEKVSGSSITIDNFTIGTNTSASCFNISAGNHNVLAQKTGWFDKNQTFTVAALTNTTRTIENMSYANLTIYAIDGTTNETLSGYDLSIYSLNHSGWGGEVANSVTNHSFYLINGTYNVTIDMPGYALTYNQANISVRGHTNYTFTLYKTNSVQIHILDEITGDIITDNITIRWSSNSTTWENVTSSGSLFLSNITADVYELLFYGSNYSTRSYTITVGNRSSQVLTAYMIASEYSTIFTIKDQDTGDILSDVSITMFKQINSTWSTVESKYSDISGKAQFYYDPIAHYRFYLSKTGYEDYVFYLNPILFSTYEVFMSKTTVLNYSVDFDDISIIYSPSQFFNDENVTFNFLISSPDGLLTDYGIKLTYPGGSAFASGTNAIGEQLSADVNLSGATAYDYVVLEYNYTTSIAGTRSYVFNLPIISNFSGGTWMTLKDKTYGLGIFERLLITTIIILFVVGIATMVGQAIPGLALGLFVFGFLVFIGFVPIWAVLPSMLVGILFLVWKSGGY